MQKDNKAILTPAETCFVWTIACKQAEDFNTSGYLRHLDSLSVSD